MKRSMIFLWLAAAILLSLSACGSRATETLTPEPTATEAPTNTPEPTQTPTLEPTATVEGTQPASSGAEGTPAAAAPGADPAAPAAPAAPAGGGVSVDDKYLYVSQTIPDGYQVRPNTTVTIKWTVKNVGTTAWDTTYFLDQFAGPPIKNPQVAFPRTVSANESVELTLTFTTPAVSGDYNLWMKLKNGRGERFGDVNLLFTVTDQPNNSAKPAASPTP